MPGTLIYFIPGLKGSVLYDKRVGRNIWPPTKILESWSTFFRERSHFDSEIMRLKVPADLAAGADDPNIVPTSIVNVVNIGPISGLFCRPIYNPILTIIDSYASANDTVVEFAYDWRRDVDYCARKLYDSLRARVGSVPGQYDRIILISHSYGGLISRYMIESDNVFKDPDLHIDYAINIGTPHYGSMKSVRYLSGAASMSICSDAALFEVCKSFDSLYDTMPVDGIDTHLITDKIKISKARDRRRSMNMFANNGRCSVSVNINIVNVFRMYKDAGNVICSGDGVVDVQCEKINPDVDTGIGQTMHVDLERDTEHINIMNKKFIRTVIAYVIKTRLANYSVQTMLDNNKN